MIVVYVMVVMQIKIVQVYVEVLQLLMSVVYVMVVTLIKIVKVYVLV